jgi:hypothetical protein
MDLLDRYLQAVKKHLPWQRQDDIIAELRANLEAQLEDKEAAMGRPLTAGEAEAWLKEIGPPMQVAARYQPQQYLIGPGVFPMYWYVLRMACLWAMIIYAIVSAVQIAVQVPSGTAVLEAVLRVPGILMTIAAWVTLVFAAIEFAVTRYPDKCPAIAGISADWTPASLPPMEKQGVTGKKPRSFALAVGEVVFGFIFLIWLLLIPHYPVLLGPGFAYLHASPFHLTPVWVQFYWWAVALNVVQLGWHCVDLARGTWQKVQPVKQIVAKTGGLIPLVVLLAARDHAWIALKHPALDEARYGGTLNAINEGIHKALIVVCALIVLQLAWEVGRVSLEAYRRRTAAAR